MGMLLREVQPDNIANRHRYMGRRSGCDVARCRLHYNERIRSRGLNHHHLATPKRVGAEVNMFGPQP